MGIEELSENRIRADADLTVICKNLSIPNNFISLDSTKNQGVKSVVIFRRFKSNSTCESAGEHFRRYFINQRWSKDLMEVEQSSGGMGTLDYNFRNGDYLVSVECEHPTAYDNADKKFVISCSWRGH